MKPFAVTLMAICSVVVFQQCYVRGELKIMSGIYDKVYRMRDLEYFGKFIIPNLAVNTGILKSLKDMKVKRSYPEFSYKTYFKNLVKANFATAKAIREHKKARQLADLNAHYEPFNYTNYHRRDYW